MKSHIEKYLLDRTKDISFISIKENAELNIKGYTLPKAGLDIPVLNADLAKGIQDGTAQKGISVASIARGIIDIIGTDPSFRNNGEYKKMLSAMYQDIGGYIEYSGVKMANEGKKTDAIVYFRALMELDEKNINGLYNYALLCQDVAFSCDSEKESKKRRDFLKEAKSYFEKLANEYPDFSKGIYNLAFFKYEEGEYEQAKNMWNESVEAGLDEELEQRAIEMIGLCADKVKIEEGIELVISGESHAALETLLPLVNKHAGDWKLLFFIGVAYRQLGEVQEAMMYFRDILLIDKDNVDTMVEMGLCKAMLGELKESVDHFENALKLRSDDPEILCNAAMAYYNMGDMEKANEYIQKSFEIDPDDEITQACHLEIEKKQNK
ncbi:TPR repeat-containing protein [Peptoclostridium litorale DSM 5388]|uniref:Tetratricopeptide repeat protein n=1 Tax=Peptoclostridium litorale DSM 5388 TaxID=1121324 RepID=A0A069RIP5_PEPLI|nr:tetratricopeptide repeat protein [Peptoclostridium litorale]KDR96030.1 tetratricopeptide repeat protein [Peptoclostridium litorale DSM 5388]SIO06258.1 TPR repeat-containing protein [Peptoclostridium litorale DSM 5388]